MPTSGFDFDHVSVGTRDALAWAGLLREQVGAVPVMGEVLPHFRYVLMHVGDAEAFGRIEFLDPGPVAPDGPDGPGGGDGFMDRFLAARGEGAHHLTFLVPDVERVVDEVTALGHQVVGVELRHPPWREAFLMPDDLHGVVIQLADSTGSYPAPAQILAGRDRDSVAMPSSRGAVDPHWWTRLWAVAAADEAAVMTSVVLGSTDPARSHELFAKVLSGAVEDGDRRDEGTVTYRWPSGRLVLERADEPGVLRVEATATTDRTVRLGSLPLHITAGQRQARPGR